VNVLLVEENERIRQFVAKSLLVAGHTAHYAAHGCAEMLVAAGEAHDVIILDRILPAEISRIADVETLRNTGRRTPILFLNAESEIDDRYRILRTGNDDYLPRPFAFADLLTRLDALFRRSRNFTNHTIPFSVDNLRVDPITRKVTRGDRLISLRPREFKLLEYLISHAGQVVTRTMLLEHVWNYRFDPHANMVDAHISILRQKVDLAFERPLLRKVRNAGYTVSGND
jgi:two-component system OmpR family response regulator